MTLACSIGWRGPAETVDFPVWHSGCVSAENRVQQPNPSSPLVAPISKLGSPPSAMSPETREELHK